MNLCKSVVILSLCACSKGADEPTPVVPPVEPPTPPVQEQAAMAFGPLGTTAQVSRDATALENTHTLFRVWSYKHTSATASQEVMPGYNVKYIDNTAKWQYDGLKYTAHPELQDQYLKYWDESALSYDFYAYAPVDLKAGMTSASPETGLVLSGIPTHTSDSYDYIVAAHKRTNNGSEAPADLDAITNQATATQPTELKSIVPLQFHHILSKVEYRIYNVGTKTALINNITLSLKENETFYTAGSFTGNKWGDFTATSRNLVNLNYATPLSVAPISEADYKTEFTPLTYNYEIPQTVGTQLNISLDVDGSILTKSIEVDDLIWEFDKNYIYYIKITVNDGDLNPIYIDLEIEDFVAGTEIDGTVDNW